MKLESLEFKNSSTGWHLNSTDFYTDLTLLVGVSGVKKNQILDAIATLRKISEAKDDEFFWGIAWDVKFTSHEGVKYHWSGQFEDSPDTSDQDETESNFPYWRGDEDSVQKPKVLK